MDCRRIHGGGDVHEMQVGCAAPDLDVANITDQREIGVVDRDGQLRLIVESGRDRILRILRRRFDGRRRGGMERRDGGKSENERCEPVACRHERLLLSLERSRSEILQPMFLVSGDGGRGRHSGRPGFGGPKGRPLPKPSTPLPRRAAVGGSEHSTITGSHRGR